MSFPNIPNITPAISVNTGQTVPLLLSSIAFEELALAHLMNAEAEKLQFVLGTLGGSGVTFSPAEASLGDLLDVNASVQRTLRDVIKKEMLLEFKFENVLDLIGTVPCQILMTLTELNPCLISVTGTVTCSGQLVTTPVTITFTVTVGQTFSQTTIQFPTGMFSTSIVLSLGLTGELTVTAATTVNGVTVSTTESINVNCPGPGVAGIGEGVLFIEPYEAGE